MQHPLYQAVLLAACLALAFLLEQSLEQYLLFFRRIFEHGSQLQLTETTTICRSTSLACRSISASSAAILALSAFSL